MKKRILLVGTEDLVYLPLCVGVLRCLFRQKGWDDIEVRSCGFFAVEGQVCSPYLQTVAGEMGIDLSAHRATLVSEELVQWADWLIPQNEMVFRGLRQYVDRDLTNVGKQMKLNHAYRPSVEEYRLARDEVLDYCRRLLRKMMTMQREERKLQEAVVARLVTEKDVSQVRRLEELCFSHPWTEQSIAEELAKEDACFYGLFYQERLLAYGSLWHVLGQATINNIAVDPRYRKQGLGNRVLAQLEEHCRAHRVESITLEVRSKNLTAQRLYYKNGYQVCGCRKGFYRDPPDDGLIMTKLI